MTNLYILNINTFCHLQTSCISWILLTYTKPTGQKHKISRIYGIIDFFYRVSHKKGIDKKLLIGPAHGFNSQLLNLFGFSVSVSFV